MLIGKFLSYRWEQEALLDGATIELLLQRHQGSLSRLSFRRSSVHWGVMTQEGKFAIEDFSCSQMASSITDWLFDLAIWNSNRLRRLHIGAELDLVTKYKAKGLLEHRSEADVALSDNFLRLLHDDSQEVIPTMVVDDFHLTGFRLPQLLSVQEKQLFDLNSLKTLRLESCTGLVQAFHHWSRTDISNTNGRRIYCENLRTFILRTEERTKDIMQSLGAFLVSLNPLKTLHVLFEGPLHSDLEESVVKHHGPSLRSLIWDHRIHARSTIKCENRLSTRALKLISTFCVNLQALGISIDWSLLPTADYSHKNSEVPFTRR